MQDEKATTGPGVETAGRGQAKETHRLLWVSLPRPTVVAGEANDEQARNVLSMYTTSGLEEMVTPPLNLVCTVCARVHATKIASACSGSVRPGCIYPVKGFVIFVMMASANI